MNIDWQIWRVVMSGKASLRDLQSWYDVNDLADFHELLDIELEMMPDQSQK